MEYLGLDIWMEILSGLGVKDLIRLKSVSKTFLDLICSFISNDDFIRLHLNKSSFRAIHLNRHFDIGFLNQQREVDKITTIFCGSCNGLVCLWPEHTNKKYGGGILLWNPALRKAECVPIKRRPPLIFSNCHFYWFGYDSEEYKLILGTFSHFHLIRLYIDTDTWKSSVQMDKNYDHYEEIGTLVHRTVHWPAYCLKDHKDTIISYDLRNETVGRIAMPDGMPIHWPFVLGEVDGCLSSMFMNKGQCHGELWVMKEYGVEETWIKLMILPSEIYGAYRYRTLKPNIVELDDPAQLCSPIYGKDFYVESLISPRSIKPRCAD